MKSRIEELAHELSMRMYANEEETKTITETVTTAVNEALELAAKECAGKKEGFASKSTWDYAVLECAEAIRKLKV
jgi:hypothetical protein